MLWFWGLCGTFAYAAPRLHTVLREARVAPGPFRWGDPVAEFVISMACGCIWSVAGTPWVGHRWHWTVEPNAVALAAVLGYLANAAAPLLSKGLLSKLAKKVEE